MTDLLYRKKPVVIEAMQFQPIGSSGEDAARVESWCGGEMVVDDQGYSLVIKTLEGHMRASPGDWIIKGVKGEFYPCKPDIFEQTYESAALPAVRPDARIKEYEEAYQYAFHLAKALRENYPPNPDFRFLGDLVGLLTQIDNMVAGLSQTDAREAALREALAAVNAKWRSGADTPDEMRGIALAEAAILDLIEGGSHD